jgi:uncharacterized protein
VLDLLKKFVKNKLMSSPGCHDWEHTQRVLHNALIIADAEAQHGPDLNVIAYAALLHDIARSEELLADSKVCHAELGAQMVADIFQKLNILNVDPLIVAECVRRHRYRNNKNTPETIEQKIIFDADKLDSLGAIGVARAIHFSGRIGSVLHNSKEIALNSEAYSKQDSAYREYLVKLQYIPEKMLTDTGRVMAVERFDFMRLFFEQMNIEVDGANFKIH